MKTLAILLACGFSLPQPPKLIVPTELAHGTVLITPESTTILDPSPSYETPGNYQNLPSSPSNYPYPGRHTDGSVWPHAGDTTNED